MVRDREAWHAAVHGFAESHNVVTEQHKKVNSKANKITRDKAEHYIIKIQSSKEHSVYMHDKAAKYVKQKLTEQKGENRYSWETSTSLSQQCTEQLERKSVKVQKTSVTPQSTGSN